MDGGCCFAEAWWKKEDFAFVLLPGESLSVIGARGVVDELEEKEDRE